jgi:hypothetical protein
MKILMKEHKARDYLTSANESKDRALVNEKHKTKSGEGKLAAQTRKVNLAKQGEAKSLEEKAAAEEETERQRELREKIEADKSTLMITTAGLSAAIVNLSAGDKVCCGLFIHSSYYLT